MINDTEVQVSQSYYLRSSFNVVKLYLTFNVEICNFSTSGKYNAIELDSRNKYKSKWW